MAISYKSNENKVSRYTICLHKKHRDFLGGLAERSGYSISETIRQIVEEKMLDESRKNIPLHFSLQRNY